MYAAQTSPARLLVAPSILAADFAMLGEEVAALEQAGADMVHMDVMDGNFVPNLSFGAAVIASLRSYTRLAFDVHLMIDAPENHIDTFLAAHAACVTFHIEACKHPHRLLGHIRRKGTLAGLALNPGTPLCMVEPLLGMCDRLLVMSVNPGFGGQSFIGESLKKIATLRAMLEACGAAASIEVDGGIDAVRAAECAAAGADIVVAGSYVFGNNRESYKERIESLRTIKAQRASATPPDRLMV